MKSVITIKFQNDVDAYVEVSIFPQGSGWGEDYTAVTKIRVMSVYLEGHQNNLVSFSATSLTVKKSNRLKKVVLDRVDDICDPVLDAITKTTLIGSIESYLKNEDLV